MSPASWTAAALSAAAAGLLAQLPSADGHLYLMAPVSRNLYGTSAFQESGSTTINYCPHCFQSRGPAAVRERGGGAPWPHFNGERAKNGNYIESEEVAMRHGICGDPEQTAAEGSNLYGQENSNYPVLETYAEGGILEAKFVASTYHWGHIEMFLCDSGDLSDPEGVVTQSCFNKYPLDRAEDDEFNAPIDPENRGRFILDPPCRAAETDQTLVDGAFPGDVATARFKLPAGVTCDRCIVQMVYYTGNSCQHQGYAEFNPPSWPSSCAPNKEDWINESVGFCGDGDAYPEEFWNCADISITSDGGPGSSPPPPPRREPEPTPTPEMPEPEPTYEPEPMPTYEPEPEPTYEPEPMPTYEPEPMPTYESEPSPAPTTVEEEEDKEEEEYDEEYDEESDDEEYDEPTPSPIDEPATPMDEPYAPEGTFAPSVPGPVTPTTADCEDPVGAYNQCGGTDYEGSTCCRMGYECEAVTDCYSECRPSEDRCSEGWAQCGGIEWEGPTCCWDGAVCLERNEWYSQCVPEEYP